METTKPQESPCSFLFFSKALASTRLRKKMENLQKSRVWSCQSLHIPQQPEGLCCAAAEVKGKPLLPAAGAAPQRSCRSEFPMPGGRTWACCAPAAVHTRASSWQPLPTASCTALGVILGRAGLASARLGHLLSSPRSLPTCLNVYSRKEMGKWEGPEMWTALRCKRYERGQLEEEGRSRGGDCFNPSFFIKQKNKWSQVAYVIMMNNIQSTCIAIIIKHVFVVQVKIQGLYSYWPARGKHMILSDQKEPQIQIQSHESWQYYRVQKYGENLHITHKVRNFLIVYK